MAVFAVYAPPGDLTRPELAERTVFVREGFRFLALVLPFLYFLIHRAFLPLVLYLAGLLVLNLAASMLGLATAAIVLANLLYAVLFGMEGPGLRQWSLRRKGLEHVASVVARRGEEAEILFFGTLERRPPRRGDAARPTPTAMMREDGEAFLFAGPERHR